MVPTGNRRMSQALKALLQVGWSAWITVVVATNVLDALQVAAVLPRWKLPSGNFEYIRSTTAIYHVPTWIDWLLFIAVIVWEAGIASQFWRSARSVWQEGGSGNPSVLRAYLLSLPLWLAFMIACEVFLAWSDEPEFISLLIAQGVTLLIVMLVPDMAKEEAPALSERLSER
jgi:hypothetical protein